MSEGRLEAGKTDSVEVVQVQLSHETCKIAVFEVNRQHFLAKPLHTHYAEARPILIPAEVLIPFRKQIEADLKKALLRLHII